MKGPWDRRRYRKDTLSRPSQYGGGLKENLAQIAALEIRFATEEELLAAGYKRLPDVCDEQVWAGPDVPEDAVAELKEIMTKTPEFKE